MKWGRKWKESDKITADLLIENGGERHANIKLNGKPVERTMSQLGGMMTLGDFTSIPRAVFDRTTRTQFTWLRDEALRNVQVSTYRFVVARENSRWKVSENYIVVIVGYSGTVWIARDSGDVLRLEIQPDARDLPPSHQMESRGVAIDYGFVPIGEQQVLVPLRSEHSACHRSGPGCQRNLTEFRNYHLYTADSKISFQ